MLIADDHVMVREGLAAIIGRQPDMAVVGEAATGREVVDLWRIHRPDVTLLDLQMPILDGVSAIVEIRHGEKVAAWISPDLLGDILRLKSLCLDVEAPPNQGCRDVTH